jgi:BA14K-like protein
MFRDYSSCPAARRKHMTSPRVATAVVTIFALWAASPALAQNIAAAASGGLQSNVRAGTLHDVWFDGRDDVRDFPNNGFFPGDFAADPVGAAIGAAGIFGSRPVTNYYAPQPQPEQAWCAHRYRSYDWDSGTILGRDGLRRHCP